LRVLRTSYSGDTANEMTRWLHIRNGWWAFILALLAMGDRACQNEFEQGNMSDMVKTWSTVVGKELEKDYEKAHTLMRANDCWEF
jgi:hypothetical protein